MTSATGIAGLESPECGLGHAVFATRIGVCTLAWHAQGVWALQLPEANAAATRDRMLAELTPRVADMALPAPQHWPQAERVEQLPEVAVQAVAGVQQLLSGWQALAGLEADDAAAWPGSGGPQVLGDLRAARSPTRAAGKAEEAQEVQALPQLLDVALEWHGVPAFARNVYALARAIAPGQTRTYGDLALDLGGIKLSRAVGQALGSNPFAPIVPCHRVLAAGREPGGFSGGQGALTKLRMLELEGAAWGGTRSLFE